MKVRIGRRNPRSSTLSITGLEMFVRQTLEWTHYEWWRYAHLWDFHFFKRSYFWNGPSEKVVGSVVRKKKKKKNVVLVPKELPTIPWLQLFISLPVLLSGPQICLHYHFRDFFTHNSPENVMTCFSWWRKYMSCSLNSYLSFLFLIRKNKSLTSGI